MQNTGWLDANDIGMTFATIGILLGLIGGIIQIKIATIIRMKNWFKIVCIALSLGLLASSCGAFQGFACPHGRRC